MELIPLTDFDQRFYPDVSEEEKIQFVVQSNSFERIITKEELVRSAILMPQKADPLVSGQMRAIALIEQLAKQQDLLPKAEKITPANFDKHFPWFVRLHKNLLHDFAQKGQTLLNIQDYPSPSDLGTYRQEDKKLGSRLMPDPSNVKSLLTQAFQKYCKIYHTYSDSLSNPRLLETEDWQKLEDAAYKLNIRICCIKPFLEGSNRVARLTENLLRLNAGLRFRILTDKEQLLRDIWQIQDSEYKA